MILKPIEQDSRFNVRIDKVPMDIFTYQWMANAVDNIILMARHDFHEECIEGALNLKHKFFKYATFRLAGGITNFYSEDKDAKTTIHTETFTIAFMKYSAIIMEHS